jgi:transcriptional regulator with XRE-family HTH domain
MKDNIEQFGRRLVAARGSRGVREIAKEVEISAATLSRVERGYMPDLETFAKICRWLKVDPAEILGVDLTVPRPSASVHFKKNQAIHPKTAKALAELIVAASRARLIEDEEEIGPSV